MSFTISFSQLTTLPLKKKRRYNFVTNNKGQYYNNEKILIKNHNTSDISSKIDKNMSNLTININVINDIKNKNKKINEINELIKIINDDTPDDDITEIVADTVADTIADLDEMYKDKPYTRKKIYVIIKMLKLTVDTIENVYQQKYNNDINATGLGDFIRGSYFLMQFCKEYNMSYRINLRNHPISQFLDMYQNSKHINYKNVNYFEKTNHSPLVLDNDIITNIYDNTINNDFLYFLSKQKAFNKIMYVYTITYPTIIIDQAHKEVMKQILKPTDKLSLLTNNILTNLNLCKHDYVIIHIRFGDDYLIKSNKTIDTRKLDIIVAELNKLDMTKQYLLISDNDIIKKQIVDLFPFIKTHFNKITHTGEGVELDMEELQNTMIDFYLLSHSTKIIAFSVYDHGTGFSKWCAETYNIPYTCQLVC